MYTIIIIVVLALGAWLLSDAAYRNSGIADNDSNNEENNSYGETHIDSENNTEYNKSDEISQSEIIDDSAKTDNEDVTSESEKSGLITDELAVSENTINNQFALKGQELYVQLRLVVTSKNEYREQTVAYIQKRINSNIESSTDEQTTLSASKNDYETILNTIIDCPHTESVVYKNEDYFPIVEELFNSVASLAENIPEETVNKIQEIEQLCEKVIVVVK